MSQKAWNCGILGYVSRFGSPLRFSINYVQRGNCWPLPIPMKAPDISNTIVDEANRRTYVILAPRVLTDGELYQVIRRELLRRGGKPLGQGENEP